MLYQKRWKMLNFRVSELKIVFTLSLLESVRLLDDAWLAIFCGMTVILLATTMSALDRQMAV